LTKRPHFDAAHARFNRIRQVAPTCTQSNMCLLGPTRVHIPNGISIGSAVFAQLTAESPYSLQWAAPFPVKIAPLAWGSGPLFNAWFCGPTRVCIPKDISIDSAFLQGSRLWQTDRQTDHDTLSVTTCRIYVRSTAIRPKIKMHGCAKTGPLTSGHRVKKVTDIQKVDWHHD